MPLPPLRFFSRMMWRLLPFGICFRIHKVCDQRTIPIFRHFDPFGLQMISKVWGDCLPHKPFVHVIRLMHLWTVLHNR
jgi:hypothetical protein